MIIHFHYFGYQKFDSGAKRQCHDTHPQCWRRILGIWCFDHIKSPEIHRKSPCLLVKNHELHIFAGWIPRNAHGIHNAFLLGSWCQRRLVKLVKTWKVPQILNIFYRTTKHEGYYPLHMYIWSRVPCSHPPHGMGGYDAPVVVYIHTYLHTYLPTYIPTYIHTYHYITLPYLTLPYLTLPYLTFHTYIPLHYLTLHYLALPYITLPYIPYIHTYITYIHTLHTYIHTSIHTNIPTYQHTTTTGHRGGTRRTIPPPQATGGGTRRTIPPPQATGGGTRRTRRYCPPIPIGGGEGGWPTLHHIYTHIYID